MGCDRRKTGMTTNQSPIQPEPPPILVRAFLDASLDALRFLADLPDFRSSETVEQMTDRGIVAVDPRVVSGVFWVRRRFSTGRLAGEMTYGERELDINLIVGPVSTGRRAGGAYALWEWVAAYGGASPADAGPWPATAERVRTAVATLGAVFQAYAPRIEAAERDIIEQIERARDQRQAAWSAELAERKHRSATEKAADAFRAGDYARVVALLEPHGPHLTPAERAKLAIARKRARTTGG